MRSLRGVGVLFSFLIVGVLGGLMAPLSSEASGVSLTLQVDGVGTPTPILGAQVTTGCKTGFTSCYAILSTPVAGNLGKSFKAVAASGAVPRLNIADVVSGDKMELTGLQFTPESVSGFPLTEVHYLTIVVKNTYDVAGATSSATGNVIPPTINYNFGLHIAGWMSAWPTPLLPNTVKGNLVKMVGQGKFTTGSTLTTLTNASNPPHTTQGTTVLNDLYQDFGNSDAKLHFGEDQISLFPTNPCLTSYTYNSSNNTTTGFCKPQIIETITATMVGPDTLLIENSADGAGTACKLTPADGVDTPTGPPLPCHSQGNKKSVDSDLTKYFSELTALDIQSAIDQGATQHAIACEVDCPCNDPDTCKGEIDVVVKVTPATKGLVFPFIASGEGFGDAPGFGFTLPATDKFGKALKALPDLKTVGQSSWIITTDDRNDPFPGTVNGNWPAIDASTNWDVDSIDCESKLNRYADPLNGVTEYIVSTWRVDGGSDKRSAYVDMLGGGDTVTCIFHAHKNSGN